MRFHARFYGAEDSVVRGGHGAHYCWVQLHGCSLVIVVICCCWLFWLCCLCRSMCTVFLRRSGWSQHTYLTFGGEIIFRVNAWRETSFAFFLVCCVPSKRGERFCNHRQPWMITLTAIHNHEEHLHTSNGSHLPLSPRISSTNNSKSSNQCKY